MTDAGDPQDVAEALDADKMPGDSDDPTAGGEYPPDEPVASLDYGTTAGEERTPEPLEERVEREADEADVQEGMRLVEPGAEDGIEHLVDEAAEAVASLGGGTDDDLSAEEAAVNPTSDPAMGGYGDGYLDGEE